MAKEILELLKDKTKYQSYSKKGYDFCQDYSNDKVKEKWIELLKKEKI